MTVKDMHYDFKKKLDKIDSKNYRNLLIPEIDWVLNEAQELFIKLVAVPRTASLLGFEKSQRTIDDIHTLVVRPESDPNACIDVVDSIIPLPENYWHYIRAEVEMENETCGIRKGNLKIQSHEDDFENSEFDKSSYEWKHVNGVFFDGGIKVFDDGTFTNNNICLTYIRKPAYIHNAEDFRGGSYKLPNGTILTGTQDSELPFQTHSEIVDLAVLITTGELNMPDYNIKQNKVNLNLT